VAVDEAFRVFQNFDRLLHRGIYEEAAWVEGPPWQVGSRARYVVIHPRHGTVSAVVTSISPPRSVALINHALGVTAEHHVSFGPDLKGGTRIRATLTLAGKSDEMSETELRELVTFLVKDSLDTVVTFCQRHRAGTAQGK
jgi:hypothetical protein